MIVNAAVQAIAEGLSERKMAKEKQDEIDEATVNIEEVDIKSKSEALVKAEEDADTSAEKRAKTDLVEGKPKRKRKTVSKKN